MKKITLLYLISTATLSIAQTCNLLNHACANTTGLFTSGVTANAGSTYACTLGNYVLYSSSSGNPYIATGDLLVNQGNAATLHFEAKKGATYSGTGEVWAHVGGYCNFNVYTTPFNTNGWVQVGSFTPTTTCATYGPFTVPSDIIGGNMISYCIVLKNASSTNFVSIDNICVSQIAGSSVPTSYTETFGTSASGWYPASGYIGVPYHTYKNASDAYVILGTGEGGGVDKAAYFYTGFDFCSTVSGTGITTKEINTAGYTNGEVRISFKSRYPCSGAISYTFDEDYTSYSPEVFVMEGPDDGTNTWIPLPVNYYFSDYTWRVASYDISAYKNSNIRIKVERGGFCGTAMEAVDNIKVLDRNCAISLLSCGTISGETAPAPSTPYPYSVPAVAGATYYKWFVRSGGNLYDTAPYIVSGQGTQNATIDFGTLPAAGLRVLCIPYDANPAVVADACYAQIGYLGVTLTTAPPLTLDNATATDPTCFGDSDGSITLSVSGGTPSYTYTWNPNVSSTNAATNLSAGTYEITITDQNSNQLTETIVLTDPSEILISGLSDASICSDEIYTTAASVSGGTGSYTYNWTPATSVSDVNALNPDFSPSALTTYTLTVEDALACSASASFNLTINPIPTVDLGPDQTVCTGDAVLLNAGIDLSNDYLWSSGETSNTLLVSAAGNYSVTVTNSLGCNTVDDFELFLFAPVVVELGGPYSFCEGTTHVLDAGAGFASYAWSTSANTQTIVVSASGIYNVVVTSADGCEGSDEATVTAVEPPSVYLGPDILSCGNPTLLDAGAGYDTYLWSTSETSQTITVNATGNYWVQVTTGPCENSDTLLVDAENCAGLSDNEKSKLSIYPNPVNDLLHIQNLPTDALIMIYDVTGKLLVQLRATTASLTLNTEGLNPGLYTLIAHTSAGTEQYTFVKI